jgi:hypothetical protein
MPRRDDLNEAFSFEDEFNLYDDEVNDQRETVDLLDFDYQNRPTRSPHQSHIIVGGSIHDSGEYYAGEDMVLATIVIVMMLGITLSVTILKYIRVSTTSI